MLVVVGLVLFAGFSFLHGPTSGQIRLDTGDLRYCWWGIPMYYKPMPEPQRSKLLALALTTPAVPAKWVTCVTYPKHYTNNPDVQYRGYYWSIGGWADADPTIARLVLQDVTAYVEKRPTANFLFVLSYRIVDNGKVYASWRDDEEVKAYCLTHGYVPPPAPPTSRPQKGAP